MGTSARNGLNGGDCKGRKFFKLFHFLFCATPYFQVIPEITSYRKGRWVSLWFPFTYKHEMVLLNLGNRKQEIRITGSHMKKKIAKMTKFENKIPIIHTFPNFLLGTTFSLKFWKGRIRKIMGAWGRVLKKVPATSICLGGYYVPKRKRLRKIWLWGLILIANLGLC